jgi:catechol 2,3-dioxygenase-like lactoylglutathione lyase family enzyme
VLFVRNVTFMTARPRELADFWSAALGLTERRDEEAESIVADEAWTYPRLTFQKVPSSSTRPCRLHLDLTADDRAGEVRRLCSLGATEVRDASMADGFAWTVLTDPDGNEFCVTDP